MTITSAPDAARGRPRSGNALRSLNSVLAIILCGVLAAFALSWPGIVAVWTTGAMSDTDDAMRLVEVRDWMAGQGWFDLTQHRLFPPAGVFMHWSRVIDIPLALSIRFFSLFLTGEAAERVARIVFPMLLQAGLIAGMAWLAKLLAGRRALVPTVALTVLSGMMFVQFQPGSVDHHAMQIVLLILMLGATLELIDPAHARKAAFAGILAALSLAISVENLPFIAVTLCVAPIAWIWRADGARYQLAHLGLALGGGTLLAMLVTVPPSRYFVGACDNLSVAHLMAAETTAILFVCLSLATPWLATRAARLAAAMVAGFAVLVGVALCFPACLHDPFLEIDPVVREIWLNNVTEARPLLTFMAQQPNAFVMVIGPIVCGAAGVLAACLCESGLARARWFVVAAFLAIGCAVLFFMLRVSSSVGPIALLGGAWAVAKAFGYEARTKRPIARAFALVSLLPFAPVAWAIAANDDPAQNALIEGGVVCRSPEALRPVARLSPGLIFAPIDEGSHLLATTQNSVIAAPYHRNNAGNRLVIDAFLSPPDVALPLVRASGARYVAICPGGAQLDLMSSSAPEGLANALLTGRTPEWLHPVPLAGTPYRIFEIY